MISTLLRILGIDIKRLAQEAAITIVLAILGGFAAILALALGSVGFYLWLKLQLGAFAALGILGGTSALLAIVLFAIVFRRSSGKPHARAENTLRATVDPVQASASSIALAADEAVKGAADIVRNGSRQQIAGTIAMAVFIGLLLGRRF